MTKKCSNFSSLASRFVSHILYQKQNSTKLYKDNFFIFSNNILLYVYYVIEHRFLFFRKF
jgi:hypothetical protein